MLFTTQFFDELPSTQDHARNVASQTNYVFATTNQTKGYGRQGRAWHMPPGNLAATLILAESTYALHLWPFVVGLALHQALNPYVATQLKWPNDVLINGAKLAGILIEKTAANLLVGVGLNIVASPQLPDGRTATHLQAHTTAAMTAQSFLPQFLTALEPFIINPMPAKNILQNWQSHATHTLNSPMSVHNPQGQKLHGTFAGLDSWGRLQLSVGNQIIILSSADIIQ
jgi:BirA family transcriptional regulator, biotin operon repressor / biotin---[acetyl-CoA-carboxylase] ligase